MRAGTSTAAAGRQRLGRLAAAVAGVTLRWVVRIGLPLGGAILALAAYPVHVTAAGVHFQVQGSLFHDTGLTADTTFGSWVFPDVDLLPVGVHLQPVNVDLVRLAQAVHPDPAGFARRLRSDLVAAVPGLAVRLAIVALIGLLAGAVVAAAARLALRQLRGLPRRPGNLRRAGHAVMGAVAAVVLIGDVGVATYHPDWTHDSRLTGTLASLQLFPGRLSAYYSQHGKALDALSAVAAIQSGLQQRIDTRDVPPTAYNIMFISDMHLASTYPLVRQYARRFHVKLIVNTGDESEFGTRDEMTPAYLNQLRAVTRVAPMIWLAGNHDSPATVAIMRRVPHLTVLGVKRYRPDGTIRVSGRQLDAFGLRIAAVPDPRVYGGPGVYGADDPSVVDPLEQRTIDRALAGVPANARFDIFATHEPVAAAEALADLKGRIRETVAGHVHQQNPEDALQSGDGPITLVEGSTGAGGLDNLAARTPAPPMEFSVESVAANCQFTKIVRFQITGLSLVRPGGGLPQVTAATHYFTPQPGLAGRSCGTGLGLTAPAPLSAVP